jgi:hypothetical protein
MDMMPLSRPFDPKISPAPRRANDFLVHPRRFRPSEPLFDEFWREGELALLFGPGSSGKSVLAVQLGDALARGGGLPGFAHPRGRRRVLYVDLQHTDEQFQLRCAGENVRHRFPMNLFRDRRPVLSRLCEWLRSYVLANRVQVVIIDDLSVFRNTCDGTRETVRLMRGLRELRDELGISILAITDSATAVRGTISERELGRSRVLCSLADSVFAIYRGVGRDEDFYLLHMRSRSQAVEWTEEYAPSAKLGRAASGLLSFEFDDRFTKEPDPETLRLIREVKRLADAEGKSYRQIAFALGISKSWACKLRKRWTPAMSEPPASAGGQKYAEEVRRRDADRAEPPALAGDKNEGERVGRGDAAISETPASAGGQFAEPFAPTQAPNPLRETETSNVDPEIQDQSSKLQDQSSEIQDQNPAPIPRLIRDLEPDVDPNGREIWVESRRQDDARPKVWYTPRNNRGEYTRCVLGNSTINLCNVGSSGLVPHDLPIHINDQSFQPKLKEWQSRTTAASIRGSGP